MTPGRLEIPGVRNSGISATVGLGVVIAVLLVAGTLALSGDGILSRGGLIGGGAGPASLAPGPSGAAGASGAPGATDQATEPADAGSGFSCEPIAIRDPERARWRFVQVEAGPGEGFEQVVISLARASGRARQQDRVRTEWLTPDETVQRFEIPAPAGSRALVLTFETPVTLDSDRSLDAAALEGLGVQNLRSIQVTAGPDDQMVAVIGVAGEGCARLTSPRWARRGTDRTAEVLVDVQLP